MNKCERCGWQSDVESAHVCPNPPPWLTSSSTASCSNVPTELDVAEDKIREMETLITVLRDDIRELYSMRGEDELTAKYCNAILTATADI